MAKERQTERRRLEDEQKRNARKEVFSWVRMFATVIVVVFVLTHFIIINAKVPSGSMENTIMTHDRLIGFRFAYWFDEPQRGDIILFEYPVDEKQTYIKRVIGLPGETVEIRDGHIYIDGSEKPLEEDYLKETWIWENDGYTFEVPEGCYFAPRCKYCQEICRHEKPQMQEVGPGHMAACHFPLLKKKEQEEV